MAKHRGRGFSRLWTKLKVITRPLRHMPPFDVLFKAHDDHNKWGFRITSVAVVFVVGFSLWATYNSSLGTYFGTLGAPDNAPSSVKQVRKIGGDVTWIRDQFATMTKGGQTLVALTDDQIHKLRTIHQAKLDLFYYDSSNSLILFDEAAPEFKPGQFLNMKVRKLFDAEDSTSAEGYRYILVIDESVEIYTVEDLMKLSNGDWQVGDKTDCETLLVLTADHPLSAAQQTRIKNRLKQMPAGKFTLGADQYYEWLSGEIIKRTHIATSRSAVRNPNAPVDWVRHINNVLFEEGLAFHGYTYPVAIPSTSPGTS